MERTDHRKFLKRRPAGPPVGSAFPDRLALQPDEEAVPWRTGGSERRESALLILSSGCAACRLELAVELAAACPGPAYAVLLEGRRDVNPALLQALEEAGVPVRECDIDHLARQAPIRAIPYLIAIDPQGRVAASGIVNTLAQARRLIAPLLGSFGRRQSR